MENITKKYNNGEITIVWKPAVCIHSTKCFRSLPNVFDPRKRPWITPAGTETNQIIEQINQCPSGALSYFKNEMSLPQAVEAIKINTRQYAKRQMTWFRNRMKDWNWRENADLSNIIAFTTENIA